MRTIAAMSRDLNALPHGRRDAGVGPGGRGVVVRVARAWRALAPEQRLAATAALALWVTMLLPWYVDTIIPVKGGVTPARETLTAFGSFSFVEAAVLLVSVGILVMLFARAERRAFHLPGGDGWIVTAAGVWTTILIFYRMLDTPHASVSGGRFVTDVGLKWGIFLALFAALGLAYAGTRVRAAHRPEPNLADDPTTSFGVRAAAAGAGAPNAAPVPATAVTRAAQPAAAQPAAARPRYPPGPVRPAKAGSASTARTRRVVSREDAEQLSFDVPGPSGEPDPFGERRR